MGDAVIDVVDEYGGQINDMTHNVRKVKLDKDGNALDQIWTGLGADGDVAMICSTCDGSSKVMIQPSNAEKLDDVCCTCTDVKEYYERKRLDPAVALKSTQCAYEQHYYKEGADVGCRVVGQIELDKVKGNLHVAAGESREQRHGGHSHHVHTLNPHSLDAILSKYNISHRVNKLQFGKSFPGLKNALDFHDYNTDSLMRRNYYIDLIPTVYDDHGKKIYTNQYSYTIQDEIVDYKSDHWHLPGIFFNFDFFPLRVQMTRLNSSFSHLMTRLCAIVGGTYVVVGVVYSSIFKAVTVIKKDK